MTLFFRSGDSGDSDALYPPIGIKKNIYEYFIFTHPKRAKKSSLFTTLPCIVTFALFLSNNSYKHTFISDDIYIKW
jgi:hypothetical protein